MKATVMGFVISVPVKRCPCDVISVFVSYMLLLQHSVYLMNKFTRIKRKKIHLW